MGYEFLENKLLPQSKTLDVLGFLGKISAPWKLFMALFIEDDPR